MNTPLVLMQRKDLANSHTLEIYKKTGGYQALEKAYTMQPDSIIEEVKKSNLRGLGGAGFPAGMKWSFIPKDKRPAYLVINADEGEPGTFKDKYILAKDPHMLIEGILITCYTMNIQRAYIYIRGEYITEYRILTGAINESQKAGYLKNIEIIVHQGAGAYICGEETALLESLEGKKGQPRLKPPFPAVVGLFNRPTIINNVETIAQIPHIILNGAEWFSALGCPRNGGTRIFSISGHVNKPGIYELPMGIPLRKIIYEHAGGMRDNRALKAVIPGGSSASILKADEIDVPMDFDSLKKIGSMAGSGGIIVMDETTCIVDALYVVTRFYSEESCGQCSPCREGTGWAEKILERIMRGQGRVEDAQQLRRIADNMAGRTICALADAAAMPINSYIQKFYNEFEYHAQHKKCDIHSPVLTYA